MTFSAKRQLDSSIEDFDNDCDPNRISNFGRKINLLTAECIHVL